MKLSAPADSNQKEPSDSPREEFRDAGRRNSRGRVPRRQKQVVEPSERRCAPIDGMNGV